MSEANRDPQQDLSDVSGRHVDHVDTVGIALDSAYAELAPDEGDLASIRRPFRSFSMGIRKGSQQALVAPVGVHQPDLIRGAIGSSDLDVRSEYERDRPPVW